jgi:hypothetical protein
MKQSNENKLENEATTSLFPENSEITDAGQLNSKVPI